MYPAYLTPNLSSDLTDPATDALWPYTKSFVFLPQLAESSLRVDPLDRLEHAGLRLLKPSLPLTLQNP